MERKIASLAQLALRLIHYEWWAGLPEFLDPCSHCVLHIAMLLRRQAHACRVGVKGRYRHL